MNRQTLKNVKPVFLPQQVLAGGCGVYKEILLVQDRQKENKGHVSYMIDPFLKYLQAGADSQGFIWLH
jgi:hypothetical protein